MTYLGAPVSPLFGCRTYLGAELAARSNPLSVDVVPPAGRPRAYALLSRSDSHARSQFSTDYLLRVRVFDADAVRLEDNGDLIHRLMLAAVHHRIDTSRGPLWISNAIHQYGPAELDDPDVPLFGLQLAVFWTIGLKPIT